MAVLLTAASISLAQAQPIPAPREGQTPEFPGSAERGPAVERGASDSPETEPRPTGDPAEPSVTPESQRDADACAGDPACYQSRDLQAQEDMAVAAYWMTVATWVHVGFAVIGTGVAIVGTILLLRSLGYSREATKAAAKAADAATEANRITRDDMIAEQRAWIRIDQPTVIGDFIWKDQEKATFTIKYKIMNIGKSPAQQIRLPFVKAVNGRNHRAATELIEALSKEPTRGTDMLFPNESMDVLATVDVRLPECAIGEPYKDGASRKLRAVCSFYIVGAVEYDIVLDSQRRYTAFTYHFTKDNWAGPIHIDIGCKAIPANELRLSRAGYKGMIAT